MADGGGGGCCMRTENRSGGGGAASRQPQPAATPAPPPPANGANGTPRRRGSGERKRPGGNRGGGGGPGGGGIDAALRDHERRSRRKSLDGGDGGDGGFVESEGKCASSSWPSRPSSPPPQRRSSSHNDFNDLPDGEVWQGKTGGGGGGGGGGPRHRPRGSGGAGASPRHRPTKSDDSLGGCGRGPRPRGQNRLSDSLGRSGRSRRRGKGAVDGPGGDFDSGQHPRPSGSSHRRRATSGESSSRASSDGDGGAAAAAAALAAGAPHAHGGGRGGFPGVSFDPRNDDDDSNRLVRNISLVRDTSTSVSSNGTPERTVTLLLRTGRDASVRTSSSSGGGRSSSVRSSGGSSGGGGGGAGGGAGAMHLAAIAAGTAVTTAQQLPGGHDSAGMPLGPGGLRSRGGGGDAGGGGGLFASAGSGSTLLMSNAKEAAAAASIGSRGGSGGGRAVATPGGAPPVGTGASASAGERGAGQSGGPRRGSRGGGSRPGPGPSGAPVGGASAAEIRGSGLAPGTPAMPVLRSRSSGSTNGDETNQVTRPTSNVSGGEENNDDALNATRPTSNVQASRGGALDAPPSEIVIGDSPPAAPVNVFHHPLDQSGGPPDLSTRSAPPLQLLLRDTTVTTVCSERTTSGGGTSSGGTGGGGTGGGSGSRGPDGSSHTAETAMDDGDDYDTMASTRTDSDNMCKRRKVNLLIDQCESARFPFKKKLILANMNLTVSDIPVDDVCSHVLSHSLNKLSLAGNRLSHVPDKIVLKLGGLRTLDLSQCDLRSLPRRWNLPHLKRLDLSHNRIEDFPCETMCEGLPELQVLDMYGNKVVDIVVPRDLRVLARLDQLNMGYNRIRRLPSDLDRLTSLRSLRVMNNALEKVPERVCEMDLRVIDVSSNPLVQPPVETCERGIGSMRRYYHCLRLEEKSRQKMIDEMHRKAEIKKKAQRSMLGRSNDKWRRRMKRFEESTPLLSLARRSKPVRIFDGGPSDAAFALEGDTDRDDSMSSDATSHHLAPSALDRARTEPAPALKSSEKPAPQARTKSMPGPPLSAPKAAAVAESPLPTSAKRILATAPSSGGAAAQKAVSARAENLASASLPAAPTPRGLSLDQPLEKRILEPAGAAIKVHKPFDGDASPPAEDDTGAAAALSAKPPPPPPPSSSVPDAVEVPAAAAPYAAGAAAKSAPEGLGLAQFHSSASDIDEAQLDAELQEAEEELVRDLAVDTVNDTLKVIFVGMACAGKTSMIKRLIEGRDAKIPKQEERTVGVDIYEWDPKNDGNDDRDHIDTRIVDSAGGRGFGSLSDDSASYGDEVDVRFSVWDFAGQHVYHATHELFFSPRALYVLVWDMGVSNVETQRRNREREEEQGAFKLSYDSSDDESDEGDYPSLDDNENRRADRALERDIDEKVQFWVDCIQSSAPGAAVLPVASFDDFFEGDGRDDGGLGIDEAQRRCDMLKQRLLKHEERRVQGLRQRLAEYEQGHKANSEAALRLRHLLCAFSRPKLIFGETFDDSVARVSCTKYRGFDRLAEKIVNIATGRERGGFPYPIFRGHVGARIPRMRLEVREVVRNMRDRFKVVEWGYFLDTLRERGLDNAEDVSDALHFLTNIGELSYFGDVVRDSNIGRLKSDERGAIFDSEMDNEEEEDEDDEMEEAVFVMDKGNNGVGKGINDIMSGSESSKAQDVLMSYGLSQFIFLNPRWLVAAVACVLRHDLTREINETRRLFNKEALVGWDSGILRSGDNFYAAHLNCPVITAEDACMLWQAKKITKKAAERAQEYSNNMTMTPFEFLQRLLIRFRFFVPIDLSIDKALLGGKEYGLSGENPQSEGRLIDTSSSRIEESPQFFFLPSLLGPGEPNEAWTYKNSDSWKTTLCHSILFPDGVPPGLMERITATVLSDVYGATLSRVQLDTTKNNFLSASCPSSACLIPSAGRLHVKEILCWRSAFFLKIGMENIDNATGEVRESMVEMFCALVDRESHLCVGSDAMGVGMRRLILSGKGQVGEGGRKIWQGGYTLVIKAVGRVMEEYGGLEFEKQGICPDCVAKRPVGLASVWDWTLIRSAAKKGDESIRCQFGHRVETRLITGLCCAKKPTPRRASVEDSAKLTSGDSTVPVSELLRGVVVVGLWDGKTEKIVRVGSGFVVDRKRGLVVTASHTLMNIWGDSKSPYGENYYGLRSGKVVIGVIPRERSANSPDKTTAVFRYFAQIVAKDQSIEANGVCHMDACVLQITTKMEQDVGGDGDGCGSQPEILIQNNQAAFKKEKLCQLKVSSKECELDEQVRIMGYNQGGEGLIEPGSHVNRCADFAKGYVCMKFHTDVEEGWSKSRRFKPTEEIVVICPTIGGHSGGPCVNQSGEVIGILSRADPTEKQRCYLVPATAWKGLVKRAKNSVVSPF